MHPVITAFYRALQEADVEALVRLLHPEFEGRVAPGMPYGVGGVHRGPEDMLVNVWGVIARHYRTAPYAESCVAGPDGTFVVTGRYRGTAVATGRPYEAEFAHVLRLRDDRIVALHQYTDTAKWHEALAA
ncbi:hypothetical protein GCM10010106_12890 [Thermopolyspora flexuosa]|uniref:Ketosteroid isomerase-like protein n=1 Tax=Thermopolyspora flexuosa TaxID=103836 RepID=A0A543IQ77_9ACTN|nr:nuclear transport factor 2 family protein [Thermopolyspora flexuosa]TQM72733.1 ketosteroid isomerase-like protein [Thermopolyspora flexuosa]GGM68341.1 hypothetical protein GCM10010106_12890 [Thermopolyspora flexuosa]